MQVLQDGSILTRPRTATAMTSSAPAAAPRSITARELHACLERGEPIQLVDVREQEELDLARLPHPVLHLPLSRSREWMEQVSGQLDRERPVAVLCHAGLRSWHFSCWLMEAHGYPEVWNLSGGIDAWSVEVDPQVARY
jgi:rhodanese-related sulfurtransferase